MPVRLVDRSPVVSASAVIDALVPPPLFRDGRLDSYVPDPAEPTQAAALAAPRSFAEAITDPGPARFGRRSRTGGGRGIYFDGGFGVGKTHLLASLWHAAPAPKAYATFVELTHLAGALGFAETVTSLSAMRLLAIDEFELDDPGDTVLVSSLLTRLAEAGVALAATSNMLPDRLGAGRFAAEDFRREIQQLADRFETVRVDGPDYRHRGLPEAPPPLDGISAVHLLEVVPAPDQSVALRLVVLADRLYDRQLPVISSGVPLDEIFDADMLAGGYRKKYRRAVSRLVALTRLGVTHGAA